MPKTFLLGLKIIQVDNISYEYIALCTQVQVQLEIPL